MSRIRIRDLGVVIGDLPSGTHNAITDVPGVAVGHITLTNDQPRVARTGVTVIVPRQDTIWTDHVFGAYTSFNGNGEMTGLPWLEEAGIIDAPIAITNTFGVGTVRDALVADAAKREDGNSFLPIVAETWDGWLNDISAFHITREHVYEALANARGGSVDEGNVGGGTGMICHHFKGGIGTASRIVAHQGEQCIVGVLVQANYGTREELRVNGIPIGKLITTEEVPSAYDSPVDSGSIVVIIATDAPLLPIQCKRLARRATVGLARAGGVGNNSSGDLFLAFATGNHLHSSFHGIQDLKMLAHEDLNPFFAAVADGVEESILNALVAADTMQGYSGRIAYALPLDRLQAILQRYQSVS